MGVAGRNHESRLTNPARSAILPSTFPKRSRHGRHRQTRLILSASAARATFALPTPSFRIFAGIPLWRTAAKSSIGTCSVHDRRFARSIPKSTSTWSTAPLVPGHGCIELDTPWKPGAAQAFEKFNAAPSSKPCMRLPPRCRGLTHFYAPNIISWLEYQKKTSPNSSRHRRDRSRPARDVAHPSPIALLRRPGRNQNLPRKNGNSTGKSDRQRHPRRSRFPRPKRQIRHLAALGLDPDRFTILISAGGFGVGPVELLLAEVMSMKLPAQVVAIAGKSEELKGKLEKLAKKCPPMLPSKFTRSVSQNRWMTTWPPPTFC